MAPVLWPIVNERPVIRVELFALGGAAKYDQCLVADTGAGDRQAVFQLMLDESACVQFGGLKIGVVYLGGAYAGSFPLFLLHARIAGLNFSQPVSVVGIAQPPQGFDGIAGFRFLNRFQYGNFGDPSVFGLDSIRSP